MNARAHLTPDLVGSTITLRDKHAHVTGLLTGLFVTGHTERTVDGNTSVDRVDVSARFDLDGTDWDVPVTDHTTLEVHP